MQQVQNAIERKLFEINLYEIKRYVSLLQNLSIEDIEKELRRPKIQSLCEINPVFNEAIFCMLLSK